MIMRPPQRHVNARRTETAAEITLCRKGSVFGVPRGKSFCFVPLCGSFAPFLRAARTPPTSRVRCAGCAHTGTGWGESWRGVALGARCARYSGVGAPPRVQQPLLHRAPPPLLWRAPRAAARFSPRPGAGTGPERLCEGGVGCFARRAAQRGAPRAPAAESASPNALLPFSRCVVARPQPLSSVYELCVA